MTSTELKIFKLKKQLLPNGRAFRVPEGSDLKKLLESYAINEAMAFETLKGLQNIIIPDNTSFTETDALKWEEIFGIYPESDVTLADRKLEILQRMAFPNDQLARQHYLFIQKQLQDAGYPVYVHEYLNVSGYFEYLDYGDSDVRYGVDGIRYGTYELPEYESICVNFIDKNRETALSISENVLRSCFWVGSETFSPLEANFVDIPAYKEKRFRQLILKLKPLHTAAFLQVNYT